MSHLLLNNDVSGADVNGKGSHTEVRAFARQLRIDLWKKLFGITGGVRPATELIEAIEQPGKPASWRAIQQRAQKNAELYEKAFPWVPRSWTKDKKSGETTEASILPNLGQGSTRPCGCKVGARRQSWIAPAISKGRHPPLAAGRVGHHPVERGMSAGQNFKITLMRRLVACACACACACGAVAPSGCSAQEATVPPDWKTDCVGRMQLSLPGAMDVAANSFRMLAAEYKIGTQQPRFEFIDEQQAGYSAQYYMGYFFVSHPLKPAERRVLLEAANEKQQRVKAYAAKQKKDGDGKPLVFEHFDVSPKEGYAYTVNGSMDITIALDQIVVRAASNDRQGNAKLTRDDFALKSAGLALRPLGELPKTSGVCLPYVFIRDDDQQGRAIGTTYRLQDHPDVTVWLEDSNANAPMPEQDPDKFTADYRTQFFWNARYQDRTKLKLLSRTTTDKLMDGRKGIATFVELTRKDGVTTDYGYLAVVRGDPEAKRDTPDLMLYVIRDAQNAMAKGKQPIDKDGFIKMAQTIAASVRHRPTQ